MQTPEVQEHGILYFGKPSCFCSISVCKRSRGSLPLSSQPVTLLQAAAPNPGLGCVFNTPFTERPSPSGTQAAPHAHQPAQTVEYFNSHPLNKGGFLASAQDKGPTRVPSAMPPQGLGQADGNLQLCPRASRPAFRFHNQRSSKCHWTGQTATRQLPTDTRSGLSRQKPLPGQMHMYSPYSPHLISPNAFLNTLSAEMLCYTPHTVSSTHWAASPHSALDKNGLLSP